MLVLPPWGRLYHWQSPDILQVRIPWSEFFDLPSLNKNIPVIEYEQFLAGKVWNNAFYTWLNHGGVFCRSLFSHMLLSSCMWNKKLYRWQEEEWEENFWGQLVPVPCHSDSKEFPSYVWMELPVFQFVPLHPLCWWASQKRTCLHPDQCSTHSELPSLFSREKKEERD